MLANIMLGEVSPGGVGSGLYGLVIAALLAVFLGGLMVGRTPEYLGKRIGPSEIKLVSLYLLTTPTAVLAATGLALSLPDGRSAIGNPGPPRSQRSDLRFHQSRQQQRQRPTITLPTHRPLFAGLLLTVVLLITGLTYLPALALGPLSEGLH